jgi:hypothetical protein
MLSGNAFSYRDRGHGLRMLVPDEWNHFEVARLQGDHFLKASVTLFGSYSGPIRHHWQFASVAGMGPLDTIGSLAEEIQWAHSRFFGTSSR